MKKALGRGLESLIPEKEENQVNEIRIERIIPNKYQMRTNFDSEKINELAGSIKEKGVVQPVVVKKKGRDYMLIAGERRLRAAKKAGMESIPCIEKDIKEEDALTLSLIENIQREDLTPVEEAKAYKQLIDEFDMTQKEIAEQVGKSRSSVANTLRILSLPQELREYVEKGMLSSGHARALLSIEDRNKRQKLAEKIVKEKLTVREAERLAKIAAGKKKKKLKKKHIDPELKKMEERFERIFGTKVNIKMKSTRTKKETKGTVRIEFYSVDDFERISDIICSK